MLTLLYKHNLTLTEVELGTTSASACFIFCPIELIFNMLVQMCASFSSPSMKPQLLLFPPFSFQRFIDIVFRTKICPKLGLEAKKKRNNGVLFSHNLKVEENKIRFFFHITNLICVSLDKKMVISRLKSQR